MSAQPAAYLGKFFAVECRNRTDPHEDAWWVVGLYPLLEEANESPEARVCLDAYEYRVAEVRVTRQAIVITTDQPVRGPRPREAEIRKASSL